MSGDRQEIEAVMRYVALDRSIDASRRIATLFEATIVLGYLKDQRRRRRIERLERRLKA